MMKSTEQRKRLRELLAQPVCRSPASVYDPISAKVAESVGYEIAMLSGSLVAGGTLSAPDINVHTLSEFADMVRRIMRLCNFSLMTDADTGFGNALNVMRTVQELEHAGVSALSIEDTTGALAFGQPEDEMRMVSLEEGVAKMRAAVAARSDPALVIVARTPALRIEGMASMLARVKAYKAAGVDAIFIAGSVESLDELDAVYAACGLTIMLGTGKAPLTREQLAAHGARMMMQGHHSIPAAVKALREVYSHLVKGGAPAAIKDKLASADVMDKLLDGEGYTQKISQYLK